jgi:hypothetical protein
VCVDGKTLDIRMRNTASHHLRATGYDRGSTLREFTKGVEYVLRNTRQGTFKVSSLVCLKDSKKT